MLNNKSVLIPTINTRHVPPLQIKETNEKSSIYLENNDLPTDFSVINDSITEQTTNNSIQYLSSLFKNNASDSLLTSTQPITIYISIYSIIVLRLPC